MTEQHNTSHKQHPWIEERAKSGPHLTHRVHTGLNGRIAIFITRKFGNMWTFYILALWMFGWMGLSTAGIWLFKRDPYPFNFLLFLSNLVQLFALPILAVGQQVLSKSSDKQAEQTYRDAEAILHLQDEMSRLVKINKTLTEEIHMMLKERQPAQATGGNSAAIPPAN
jgi:uncharacterized membrane protein